MTSLQSFKDDYQKREERQTEVAQAKFTPTEMVELDRLVAWLRDKGTKATRSGVVRALVVNALTDFREEIGDG